MTFRLGWIKDPEDKRDYKVLAKVRAVQALPSRVDLRRYDTPVLNQGGIGSCTAHAGVAVLGWLENMRTNSFTPRSRLYVYRKSRDIEGISGDDGSTLRATAKAMNQFGVPHEEDWPYDESQEVVNQEPPESVVQKAMEHQTTNYYKLDAGYPDTTLSNIKVALQKFPVMFGFMCFNSVFSVGKEGIIPLPNPKGRHFFFNEQPVGGHAVAAMGYDDEKGLLIKNSWGTNWGMGGYGYLPYYYIKENLAEDFWVIADAEDISMGFTKV